MIKAQVQLPDDLYREAKRVARVREMSLAEVLRRGVEYSVRVYPPVSPDHQPWSPSRLSKLGRFKAPPSDWRSLANDSSD
jgi:hypothetical protein